MEGEAARNKLVLPAAGAGSPISFRVEFYCVTAFQTHPLARHPLRTCLAQRNAHPETINQSRWKPKGRAPQPLNLLQSMRRKRTLNSAEQVGGRCSGWNGEPPSCFKDRHGA